MILVNKGINKYIARHAHPAQSPKGVNYISIRSNRVRAHGPNRPNFRLRTGTTFREDKCRVPLSRSPLINTFIISAHYAT